MISKIKITLLILNFFSLLNFTFAQDTIRLKKKPKAIIKSWYPEYKDFPSIKVGETKVLFTVIPDFKNTVIKNNDINLIASGKEIKIKETEKTNQYQITLTATEATFIELELWFHTGENIILLYHGSKWVNIKDLYPVKDDRILIDKIKLKIIK